MEVNVDPRIQAKLAGLAAKRGREVQSLVEEAIEQLVNHDEWFVREVEDGLAAADRGDFVDHEDVGKLIDERYSG